MSRSIRSVAVLAVVLVLSAMMPSALVPDAVAASPRLHQPPLHRSGHGRLEGLYYVDLTITDAHGTGVKKGDGFDRYYNVRPTCGKGTCTTVIHRGYGEGDDYVSYRLHPDRKGVFSGRRQEMVGCNAKHGVVKKAYLDVETISITPTKVRAGHADKFRGVLSIVYKPTKTGKAHGCEPAHEKSRIIGEYIKPGHGG